MEVKGAYTSIGDFLSTYKECKVVSNCANESDNYWSFEANRELKIPDYQREYRWKDKQLEELFTDICNRNSYLGQIAISHKRNEHIYYIVDGQQRLTSVIMLFTVLVRQFYVYNDRVNIGLYDLNLAENNTAGRNDNILEASETNCKRLNFQTNSFSPFQSFIAKIYDNHDNNLVSFSLNDFGEATVDSYGQAPQYISACSEFNKLLQKELDRKETVPEKLEYVKQILDHILSIKISVVVFEGNSLGESEKIFLDINEKGLRLDNEDILKAYYFRNIGDQDLALTTWKNLKQNFCEFKKAINCSNEQLLIDSFMNFILQVALFSDCENHFDFDKFDNDLRYGITNKKHICQLFTSTQLQSSFEKAVNFFDEMKELLTQKAESPFYAQFMTGHDSTTRQVFNSFISTLCKSNMKIVYIILAKIWWVRNKDNQKITLFDLFQIFSFYIISNISGLKKEKGIISQTFISSNTIPNLYAELLKIEGELLTESNEKSLTLKRDQEKGEYLSFNIQMFYNEFVYNSINKQWEIRISNQSFLSKYCSNRELYIKDHFLIQNGNNIHLIDGSDFVISQSMKLLRKRAYNFVYHKDTFGNDDFACRLSKIYQLPNIQDIYGPYELAFFEFISNQLREFYKTSDTIPSWDTAIELYKQNAQHDFPHIIAFIIQEHSSTWNKKIAEHIISQIT